MATYKLTTDGQGNIALSLKDYDMYFAGKLLRSNSKPVVLDRLGSVRAWIDTSNSVNRIKYYPFGEERKVTYSNRKKFGTYLRDDFSGLDYAEQRYYSSALGRFITPDPYLGSIRLGNPDTWNRYAYVGNNPINYTDPHGLDKLPKLPFQVGWQPLTITLHLIGGPAVQEYNPNHNPILVEAVVACVAITVRLTGYSTPINYYWHENNIFDPIPDFPLPPNTQIEQKLEPTYWPNTMQPNNNVHDWLRIPAPGQYQGTGFHQDFMNYLNTHHYSFNSVQSMWIELNPTDNVIPQYWVAFKRSITNGANGGTKLTFSMNLVPGISQYPPPSVLTVNIV
jgi:RHS repeat-associated protein